MAWRKASAAAALFLSACGGEDAQSPPALAGAAAAGKALFDAACAICHNAAAPESAAGGAPRTGPHLFGVFGAPAGRLDYAYTSRLKNSGLVWDAPTLDRFLASPQKTVPGNRMSYAGEPDAEKRAAMIEYLKTLK